MAKPLANGFPIGAIMITDKVAEKIVIGMLDHFFAVRVCVCPVNVFYCTSCY